MKDEVIIILKNQLIDKISYLQLMDFLNPAMDLRNDKEYQEFFEKVLKFHKDLDEKKIVEEWGGYLSQIDLAIHNYKKFAAPLQDIEIIGRNFDKYTSAIPDFTEIVSFGIELGWLQSQMDCSNFIPNDFHPYQTKIGILTSANTFYSEDMQLLEDSFFLYEKAEIEFQKYKNHKKNDTQDSVDQVRNDLIYNTNAYSRLTVQNFFNFVEVFVNSIGYDYFKRNEDKLSPNDQLKLQGFKNKKGSFLSLPEKMQTFSKIIRGTGEEPIIWKDEKQREEPFITFFTKIKGIRDSITHYSPVKMQIWKKIDDWIKEARDAVKVCLEVSKKFWYGCYPQKNPPIYLSNLDFEKGMVCAKNRIKNTETKNII